ncbi:uncharacterized protein LOC105203289 [Solenopsis invicta]|uniref:uncharacterized protein LOC105203289 n=1 Tax=Solenopsis invicta TaxID=13686 RepID=UPI000595E2FE|nr:uncharacterized protein LOC105203289 [Solenopsis invicta]
MYRQILLHESQTHMQPILWREDSDALINEYEFLTVTHGTSSASFLATRCLQHLAQRCASEYAVGARCVLRDFYVDDLLTSADTIPELKRAREEMVALLRRGHFELGKWASNGRDLLQDVEGATDTSIALGDNSNSRILHETRTWKSQVEWNESLPQNMHCRWLGVKRQLAHLGELRVPRFVGCVGDARVTQLHGFCERAYGACVYVRTQVSGTCRVRLLASKSWVAPIKAISLPRLELSTALLLARLMEKVQAAIECLGARVVLWSDSTITLQWILLSESRKWGAFVANRVGEIQRTTENADWRHVPSAENPANVFSRDAGLAVLTPAVLSPACGGTVHRSCSLTRGSGRREKLNYQKNCRSRKE